MFAHQFYEKFINRWKRPQTKGKKKQVKNVEIVASILLLVLMWVHNHRRSKNGDPGKGCEICETLKFRKFASFLRVVHSLDSLKNIASCDDIFSMEVIKLLSLRFSEIQLRWILKLIVYWIPGSTKTLPFITWYLSTFSVKYIF